MHARLSPTTLEVGVLRPCRCKDFIERRILPDCMRWSCTSVSLERLHGKTYRKRFQTARITSRSHVSLIRPDKDYANIVLPAFFSEGPVVSFGRIAPFSMRLLVSYGRAVRPLGRSVYNSYFQALFLEKSSLWMLRKSKWRVPRGKKEKVSAIQISLRISSSKLAPPTFALSHAVSDVQTSHYSWCK